MISTLPNELLRLVIEATVYREFHRSTYRSRQTTLRSLCLVSHRFRSIAQPLLFEAISAAGNQCLNRVLDALGAEAATVQVLHYWMLPLGSNQSERDTIARMIRVCPNLSYLSLAISHYPPATLIDIASLLSSPHHLTSLNLNGSFPTPSALPTLPSLRYLHLRGNCVGALVRLLDPLYLPSLRHLALSPGPPDYLHEFENPRFSRLLSQLVTITSDFWFHRYLKRSILAPFSSRTLVDLELDYHEYKHLLAGSHVRLRGISPLGASGHYLDQIRRDLARSPSTSLRCLYLSFLAYFTRAVSPAEVVKFSGHLAALCAMCEQRGIEVIREEETTEHSISFSEEFIRRQEKLRGRAAEA